MMPMVSGGKDAFEKSFIAFRQSSLQILSLIAKPSRGRGIGSIEMGQPTIRRLAGTYSALITCVPTYIPHPRSC
jgi:hypothetical protein